jgi:hypothetical protein
MVLEEIPVDTCKKERRLWFLISVVGSIVFIVLMTNAIVYDMRPKYGFYITALVYVVTFVSFIMYAFTQYISTKEIVSILVGKVRKALDNGDSN